MNNGTGVPSNSADAPQTKKVGFPAPPDPFQVGAREGTRATEPASTSPGP